MSFKIARILIVIGAASWLLVFVASCGGGGGAKPRKQVVLATDFDDARLGEESAKGMEAEMGVITNPELLEYIRAVGRRMLPFAPRRPFEYSFHVIDQHAPNAFALPGGYIYVSRGLLQLVNSEDELACVVGHEITHAAERHAAGRQEYGRRMNPFSLGWMRAGQLAAYGRDHERAADRGGQMIASQAGYDPIGMATFLQDMDAMERLTLGWSRLPSFFASHPATPERAATAANRAQNLKWQPRKPVAESQEAFLRQMEGLVIGPNPSEGVFRDTRFLHPDMKFSLRFPDGWQMVNTHQAVGAVEPSGDAVVVLQLFGAGDDAEAAARAYMEGEMKQARVKLRQAQPLQVGDLSAFRIEGEASTSGGTIGGSLTFIAFEGFVYRIDVMSPASNAPKFEGRGRAVVRSFRALTPEEEGSFEVVRMQIVRAEAGETLEMLSQRTGNALHLGTVAVLNDLFIDARLHEGQLLKVGIAEKYQPAPRAGAEPPLEDELTPRE